MKKALAIIAILFSLFATLLIPTETVFAGGGAHGAGGAGGSGGGGCGGTRFMGLRAWYDGIDAVCNGTQPKDEEEIKAIIWKVVLNIVTMVLQIVGYVCVGFVIWGGYLYMLARGESGKVASGKKTITNALIGLVICMTASLISGAIVDVASGAATDANFFASIFNTAFLWAGIVCAIIIVIGGISYVTSTGDPQKTAKAKNTIMYAAIGLAITLLAAAIVNLVVTAVNG